MNESDAGEKEITCAALLKAAAFAAPALILGRTVAAAARANPAPSRRLGRTRGLGGMNVLLFLTDQQRAIQDGEHLPTEKKADYYHYYHPIQAFSERQVRRHWPGLAWRAAAGIMRP